MPGQTKLELIRGTLWTEVMGRAIWYAVVNSEDNRSADVQVLMRMHSSFWYGRLARGVRYMTMRMHIV